MTALAPFDVTVWNPVASDEPDSGPEMSRVVIEKTFAGGDLEGESTGEGLFCGMSDPAAGAGYLVSERVTGRIGDKKGSFVIQHGGLMGPSTEPTTFGSIVPGSGTSDFSGLEGEVEIGKTDDGAHLMTLTYRFADSAAS